MADLENRRWSAYHSLRNTDIKYNLVTPGVEYTIFIYALVKNLMRGERRQVKSISSVHGII